MASALSADTGGFTSRRTVSRMVEVGGGGGGGGEEEGWRKACYSFIDWLGILLLFLPLSLYPFLSPNCLLALGPHDRTAFPWRRAAQSGRRRGGGVS